MEENLPPPQTPINPIPASAPPSPSPTPLATAPSPKRFPLNLISLIIILLVVAIFLVPIPFYVSEGKAVCLGIDICPRHGWNLGLSLWQRIIIKSMPLPPASSQINPGPTLTPTCRPRPDCLDAEPVVCLIAVTADMCPPAEGKFCGGIANIKCTGGYTCQLDGSYPDAGGKCIRE